ERAVGLVQGQRLLRIPDFTAKLEPIGAAEQRKSPFCPLHPAIELPALGCLAPCLARGRPCKTDREHKSEKRSRAPNLHTRYVGTAAGPVHWLRPRADAARR